MKVDWPAVEEEHGRDWVLTAPRSDVAKAAGCTVSQVSSRRHWLTRKSVDRQDPEKRAHYLEYMRGFRETHADQQREYLSKWFGDRPDYKKRHRAERPEVYREADARRRERMADGAVPYDFGGICRKFGDACSACGSHGELVVDHFTPIAKGGRDVPGNVVPMCRACNHGPNGKFERDPIWWLEHTGRMEAFTERLRASGHKIDHPHFARTTDSQSKGQDSNG